MVSIDEVIGYFTYRSFRNEPVGAPNDILWGEAELFLLISDEGAVTGTLAFPAEAGSEHKEIMDLTGSITAWHPLSARFIGKGRVGSSIAEYEYEYDCQVAHDWDSAVPPQRHCLVGTVRRNKDHGQAKGGATASFIAVKREFVEPRQIPGVALIPEAVQMLGDRTHRLRHTVWHTVRGDWYSKKMTAGDHDRLKALGWYLTDPPFTPKSVLDLTNGAGEDFLYMHRRMIGMVQEVYAKAGKPYPVSWKELPGPASPQFAYREVSDPATPGRKNFHLDPESSGFMVPPPTKEFLQQLDNLPFFRFNKTPRGMTNLMRNLAASLRSPRVMGQLTLGAYGNLIEFTVHNWMHMRWATVSRDPTTGAPAVRKPFDIEEKWDVAEYDYLGDFHSSHVNPLFWRLHGWVDDCIEAWFTAHESMHSGIVKRKDVRGIPWFERCDWVVKDDPFDWPGASQDHGHHGGHHGDDEQQTLVKVMDILREVDARPGPAAVVPIRQERLAGFARFIDVVLPHP
jgi:hypothetical protein